jgi:hypothetical protein
MSKEYTCITIREATNGYGVTVSLADFETPVDIVCEERIDGLKALKQWVDGEIIKDLKRRQLYASEM